MHGDLTKPLPGTARLERETRVKKRKAHETKQMTDAKKRDGRKCRFPRCSYKVLAVHACHRLDKHRGPGGNPDLSRTRRDWLITFCARHHAMYDKRQITVEPLTPFEWFDGPCAFYIRNEETGKYVHVGSEKRIGEPVAVGA